MDAIPEDKALDLEQFGDGDRADFWRSARHGGLECLAATYRKHRYAPHSHETYVVGIIEDGAESYVLDGERQVAPAGSVCFVNPGEVHDGEPADGGFFSYRMTYPTVELLQEVASELCGRNIDSTPYFPVSVVRDARGYQLFRCAHHNLQGDGDRLASDQTLLDAYAYLVARHAQLDFSPIQAGREPIAVARVRDYLEAHFDDETVELEDLAHIAGLSRYHLIRVFRRHTGLTPHAYRTDVRVRRAAMLMRTGISPAAAATTCGFFDQSHLNRAFKARLGVTPGVFLRG